MTARVAWESAPSPSSVIAHAALMWREPAIFDSRNVRSASCHLTRRPRLRLSGPMPWKRISRMSTCNSLNHVRERVRDSVAIGVVRFIAAPVGFQSRTEVHPYASDCRWRTLLGAISNGRDGQMGIRSLTCYDPPGFELQNRPSA